MTAPGEPAIRRDGGYDPKAVLSHAAREGLLEKEAHQNRKKVRIGKSNVRCVVIKTDNTDTDQTSICETP